MISTQFDSIEDAEALRSLISSFPADGESDWFELKGTAGVSPLTKDFKKLAAKEICAFANTYGGVLCIHAGRDNQVIPMGARDSGEEERFVSWLTDCLEPRIAGLRFRSVDDHWLVYVPPSTTAPHRSAADRNYYYRHQTQSEPMPEILIASLYRSQSSVSTESELGLCHYGGNGTQITLSAVIRNQSRVPATKPRVRVILWSVAPVDSRIPFRDGAVDGSAIFSAFPELRHLEIAAIVQSQAYWGESIIYPGDSLRYVTNSDVTPLANRRHFLGRLEVSCLEGETARSYHLLQLGIAENSGLTSGVDLVGLPSLLDEFERLTEEP